MEENVGKKQTYGKHEEKKCGGQIFRSPKRPIVRVPIIEEENFKQGKRDHTCQVIENSFLKLKKMCNLKYHLISWQQ